jgi:hypothetical protein
MAGLENIGIDIFYPFLHRRVIRTDDGTVLRSGSTGTQLTRCKSRVSTVVTILKSYRTLGLLYWTEEDQDSI